jgi:hypothetical protein
MLLVALFKVETTNFAVIASVLEDEEKNVSKLNLISNYHFQAEVLYVE